MQNEQRKNFYNKRKILYYVNILLFLQSNITTTKSGKCSCFNSKLPCNSICHNKGNVNPNCSNKNNEQENEAKSSKKKLFLIII